MLYLIFTRVAVVSKKKRNGKEKLYTVVAVQYNFGYILTYYTNVRGDVDLIKRLQVILGVISSGHNIDTDKFDAFVYDC